MLTDQEILQAIDSAMPGWTSQATLLAIGRAVEAAVLAKQDAPANGDETGTRAADWTRTLPTRPGLYQHRNLQNGGGRFPIGERQLYVGYVNWTQDPKLGHGTEPMPYSGGRLRAVNAGQPLIVDNLTVEEWGGEWKRC